MKDIKIKLSEDEKKVIMAMKEKMTLEEISEKTGIKKKKLSKILNKLVEKGIIFRH